MLKNLKKDSMFHNVETYAFINNIVINQTKKESDFLFSSVSINYRNKYYYNVKMHSCFLRVIVPLDLPYTIKSLKLFIEV